MKKFCLLSAAMLLALSCSQSTVEELETVETAEEQQETEYTPGVAEVYFSDEMIELIENDLSEGSLSTKSSSLNSLIQELGITSMERLFPDAGEYEERTRKEGLHKWYKVQFDESVSVTKATEDIGTVPGIEIAEPVRPIKIESTPYFDDPYLYYQWHYYNDGSLSDSHESGADINVAPVWENYTTGSSKVIVGVVDGGIDQTHEDLADACIGGYNFCSGSTKIVAHDHGTHVGGTIGAINNNGIGVSGIAGGDEANGVPGVRLLSCQIFQDDDTGSSGAEAIKWACDNGANIVNNSWGYDYENYNEAKNSTIPTSLSNAIDYFIKYAGCDSEGNQKSDSPMKGGLVFFAAGNSGWNTDPIGLYEPVIAVGAIGPGLSRESYSNYGDWVDICAPGGDSNNTYGMIMSTIPDNSYGWSAGTSMACPHVTGVAALVLSYFGGPGFTADALKEKLLGGANSTAISANSKIGPLVDAYGAITYGGTIAPDAVESATVSVSSNTISLSFKVTEDEDDTKAYGYLLVASEDKSLLSSDLDPSNLPDAVSSSLTEVGALDAGDEITVSISSLEFDTQYYVAVIAYDYAGNYSSLSPVYSAVTGTNHAPVISTDYDGSYSLKAHETISINYTITEPDGHSFTASASTGSDAATFTKLSDGIYNLRITGNKADEGTYTAVITATDEFKMSSTLEVQYTILENNPPVLEQSFDNYFTDAIGDQFTIDLSEHISDPDGENLSWSISSSNASVFHGNVASNVFYGTILGYGLSSVTVTGTDAKGLTASGSFQYLRRTLRTLWKPTRILVQTA